MQNFNKLTVVDGLEMLLVNYLLVYLQHLVYLLHLHIILRSQVYNISISDQCLYHFNGDIIHVCVVCFAPQGPLKISGVEVKTKKRTNFFTLNCIRFL